MAKAIIRKAYYPKNRNDYGNKNNPGRIKAEQAAKAVNGVAVFPFREAAV